MRAHRKALPAAPTGTATFHLVRHGETYWNELNRMQGWLHSPLTSKGRYAASCLSVPLARVPLRAAYASTSFCAIATAGILVAGRDLPIRTSDDLREMGLGGWEGRPESEVAAEEPLRFGDFRVRPDRYEAIGGESFAEVRERVTAFMNGLAQAHAGEDVLIVSHAITLRILLAAWEGTPWAELGETPELRPCSHNVVKLAGDGRASRLRYTGTRRGNPEQAKASFA